MLHTTAQYKYCGSSFQSTWGKILIVKQTRANLSMDSVCFSDSDMSYLSLLSSGGTVPFRSIPIDPLDDVGFTTFTSGGLSAEGSM